MARTRMLIALAIILVVAGTVMGVEFWRRSQAVALEPGSIPLYVNGRLVGGFLPGDLEGLEQAGFVDAEEGKQQQGWLLRDVLLQRLDRDTFAPGTPITVSSSSRAKSVTLTWAEVDDVDNMVLLDLSGRGTLKLVSKLEGLSTRDEWVQDVDKIEVGKP